MLDRCFGTPTWYDIAYIQENDLFGAVTKKQSKVSARLLDFYMGRLNKIFPFVATPRLVRNTQKNPLYYPIWAGPNSLGLKGANYILTMGEQLSSGIRKKKNVSH